MIPHDVPTLVLGARPFGGPGKSSLCAFVGCAFAYHRYQDNGQSSSELTLFSKGIEELDSGWRAPKDGAGALPTDEIDRLTNVCHIDRLQLKGRRVRGELNKLHNAATGSHQRRETCSSRHGMEKATEGNFVSTKE